MSFGDNGFKITIFTKDKDKLYEDIKQDLIKAQRAVDVNISYFFTKLDTPCCVIDGTTYEGVDEIKEGLDRLVREYGF